MKAIIFDCFGVLTTDYWREFVASLPVRQQPAASDLNKAYDAGFMSTTDFMDQVEAVTGRRPNLIEHTKAPATKNHQLLEYITGLKPTYKIGLLSNIATDWITEEFLTLDEQQLFDVMVFSHKVKLTKPDHRIFELVADRLGVETSDCLMVDDLEVNCTGAQETGMKSIIYTDYAQAVADIERQLN